MTFTRAGVIDPDTARAVRLLEFLAAGLRSGTVELCSLNSREGYADAAGLEHDGLLGVLRLEWLRADPGVARGRILSH